MGSIDVDDPVRAWPFLAFSSEGAVIFLSPGLNLFFFLALVLMGKSHQSSSLSPCQYLGGVSYRSWIPYPAAWDGSFLTQMMFVVAFLGLWLTCFRLVFWHSPLAARLLQDFAHYLLPVFRLLVAGCSPPIYLSVTGGWWFAWWSACSVADLFDCELVGLLVCSACLLIRCWTCFW